MAKDNVIKFGDFGISKKQSKDQTSGETCGTIHYMAPEVIDAKPYTLNQMFGHLE